MTDLFNDEQMPRFSMQEQIRCIEREINMRRRVYPRFVASGKMSQSLAEQELACMEQVLRTLRSLIHDAN